ncbi:hypothetical protein llap_1939 [Limosa lapponica baueri]|uniref:Uncharacterized protein n=1 Tax=Limosa lapponica baueri TaxID=1758121 RepID=A0A2I0UNW9_LIMLA|nr:hypothetical protein llap_1939 [Limosa lapponica baueri]
MAQRQGFPLSSAARPETEEQEGTLLLSASPEGDSCNAYREGNGDWGTSTHSQARNKCELAPNLASKSIKVTFRASRIARRWQSKPFHRKLPTNKARNHQVSKPTAEE